MGESNEKDKALSSAMPTLWALVDPQNNGCAPMREVSLSSVGCEARHRCASPLSNQKEVRKLFS